MAAAWHCSWHDVRYDDTKHTIDTIRMECVLLECGTCRLMQLLASDSPLEPELFLDVPMSHARAEQLQHDWMTARYGA